MIRKTRDEANQVDVLKQPEATERLLINGGWIAVLLGGVVVPVLKRLYRADWTRLAGRVRSVIHIYLGRDRAGS